MKILRKCKITKSDKLELHKIDKIFTILKYKLIISIEYHKIMEVTILFTLSNQFLAQIAKIIFMHFNLDEILNKYFKKRLKSQLKNKKTYTNKDKLTKPTILKVLVPSNRISTPKPSSTMPFFFPFYNLFFIFVFISPFDFVDIFCFLSQ